MRRPLVPYIPRHREQHDKDNKNNPDVEAHIKKPLARRRLNAPPKQLAEEKKQIRTKLAIKPVTLPKPEPPPVALQPHPDCPVCAARGAKAYWRPS
jgi:hypothetical protein